MGTSDQVIPQSCDSPLTTRSHPPSVDKGILRLSSLNHRHEPFGVRIGCEAGRAGVVLPAASAALILEEHVGKVFAAELLERLAVGGSDGRMPMTDRIPGVAFITLEGRFSLKTFQQRRVAMAGKGRALWAVAPPGGICVRHDQVAQSVRLVDEGTKLLGRAEIGPGRQMVGILLVEAALQIVGEVNLRWHGEQVQVR